MFAWRLSTVCRCVAASLSGCAPQPALRLVDPGLAYIHDYRAPRLCGSRPPGALPEDWSFETQSTKNLHQHKNVGGGSSILSPVPWTQSSNISLMLFKIFKALFLYPACSTGERWGRSTSRSGSGKETCEVQGQINQGLAGWLESNPRLVHTASQDHTPNKMSPWSKLISQSCINHDKFQCWEFEAVGRSWPACNWSSILDRSADAHRSNRLT